MNRGLECLNISGLQRAIDILARISYNFIICYDEIL